MSALDAVRLPLHERCGQSTAAAPANGAATPLVAFAAAADTAKALAADAAVANAVVADGCCTADRGTHAGAADAAILHIDAADSSGQNAADAPADAALRTQQRVLCLWPTAADTAILRADAAEAARNKTLRTPLERALRMLCSGCCMRPEGCALLLPLGMPILRILLERTLQMLR